MGERASEGAVANKVTLFVANNFCFPLFFLQRYATRKQHAFSPQAHALERARRRGPEARACAEAERVPFREGKRRRERHRKPPSSFRPPSSPDCSRFPRCFRPRRSHGFSPPLPSRRTLTFKSTHADNNPKTIRTLTGTRSGNRVVESRISSSFEDSIRACFPSDPSTLGNLKTPSKRMSSTAAASSYWRVAGMTYLKYGELCATHVRSALKEGPVKTASKAREAVYYRSAQWEEGKPTEQVITDLTEGLVDKK